MWYPHFIEAGTRVAGKLVCQTGWYLYNPTELKVDLSRCFAMKKHAYGACNDKNRANEPKLKELEEK